MDAKYDGIIFDLDGTLWDATKPIKQSWNEVLLRHHEIKREPITEEELEECMGLTMYKMLQNFFQMNRNMYKKRLWMNCVIMRMNICHNMAVFYMMDWKMY